MEALKSPDTAHDALDTFLTIEQIRAAEPELSLSLSNPGFFLDEKGVGALHDIITGPDKRAAIKALRLVCTRIARLHSIAYNDPFASEYMPMITKYGRRSAGKTLFKDVHKALRTQKVPLNGLLAACLSSMGINEQYELTTSWDDATPRKQSPEEYAYANIEAMLALEARRKGLVKAIHQAFSWIAAAQAPMCLLDAR